MKLFKIIAIVVALLLSGASFESNAQLKYVAKKILKAESKAATEQLTKRAVKEVTKDVMSSIPKGVKSLKLFKRTDGGWEPFYKTLNEKEVKGAKMFNKALLAERRRAIAPFNQFLTLEQINKIAPKKLNLGKEAKGSILRDNMLKSMNPEAAKIVQGFGGTAAHHIVEGTDKAAVKSRAILKKFNIDINHPANGIFLPTDDKSIFKGCLHKTSHNEEYSKIVYQKLSKCKSQNEVFVVLNEIGHSLYGGKLTLEGAKQVLNKNKLILKAA